MNDTPASKTPHTDAAAESIYDRGLTEWVPVELARQLELENTALLAALEAQEEADEARDAYESYGSDRGRVVEEFCDALALVAEETQARAKQLRATALAAAKSEGGAS